ncbi:hypothetical protein INS90_03475 [Trueperella pecoris]|uniref:Uncharacterized protein n=1 Tax=Trueperella pecoris TaxID=2733571 RepID=A0A7M1R3U2_9ACTO|nr:hypothetical protein [Trueperella pecoris]QOR48344.1 hypothetical protein INS90_03475 [Trueperella pecoris]
MSLVFSTAVLGTVAGGAYYLVRGKSTAEGREWVGSSLKAWRSKELSRDQFRVHVQETDLDDMFATFDHDGFDPYYSPEGIEEKLSKAVGSSAPKKVLDATEFAVLKALEVAGGVKQDFAERASNASSDQPTKVRKALSILSAGAGTAAQVARQGVRGSVRLATSIGRGVGRLPRMWRSSK